MERALKCEMARFALGTHQNIAPKCEMPSFALSAWV